MTVEELNLLDIDAKQLQGLLESGRVTSLELVRRYIAQIQRHDDKLHAMIQATPLELLEETARSLDQERAAGNVRGPLHGIPITIKVGDNKVPTCDRAVATLLIFFIRTILPLIRALACQLVVEALHF